MSGHRQQREHSLRGRISCDVEVAKSVMPPYIIIKVFLTKIAFAAIIICKLTVTELSRNLCAHWMYYIIEIEFYLNKHPDDLIYH